MGSQTVGHDYAISLHLLAGSISKTKIQYIYVCWEELDEIMDAEQIKRAENIVNS